MKKKIETVEIGRGIAALLVVFFHATEITKLNKFLGQETFENFWIFGHSGVDFFFVLSGFVIYLSAYRMLRDNKNIFQYLKARFLRIYPPYIIICSILLPIGIYFFHHEICFWDAFKDFILYPRAESPFLPVAWSLKHEIFFYILFSIFFINIRLGWMVFLSWTFFIIIYNIFNLHFSPETDLIFNDFNLEFLFGLLIGRLYYKRYNFKKFFFIVGVLIFFGTGISEWLNISLRNKKYFHLLYGLGAMLSIMGLLSIEKNFRKINNKLKIFFLKLGSASYSIYLVHFSLMLGLIRFLIYFNKNLSPELVFSLLTISSIFFGLLYWKFIEKPSILFCKKQINRLKIIKSK